MWFQPSWEKPGQMKENVPQHFVPAHPGADDTDSEDEEERVKLTKDAKKKPGGEEEVLETEEPMSVD